MALNSLRLLEDCDIVAAHVFPFSPRPDTPAARMPQLRARGREGPRRAAARSGSAHAALAGSTAWSARSQQVLIEGDGIGHTENFAPGPSLALGADRLGGSADHRTA